MAKFIKLPQALKSIKITGLISDKGEIKKYSAVKRESDGKETNVVLYAAEASGSGYSDDTADFFKEEADFLESVSACGDSFNYLDVHFEENTSARKAALYIVTEELKPLSSVLGKKSFSEDEVIDFGIRMCTILEALEAKNIYHGNVTPKNIYLTQGGGYKLGGFSDLESRITSFSFAAPEIYKKENADMTTDIYSLGIIMYAMCNNGKLPFEDGEINAEQAAEKRFSSAELPAPENGSRELKSVIMIACKNENDQRWKNAGNIINALLSIKDGKAGKSSAQQEAEDNSGVKIGAAAVIAQSADSDGTDAGEANPEAEGPVDQTAGEEITADDADVFDSYEAGEKSTPKPESEEKDYGSFFEDEPQEGEAVPLAVPVEKAGADSGKKEYEDINIFDSGDDYDTYADDDKSEKKSHKGLIILLVLLCIVIAGCALGFAAYKVINGAQGSTGDEAASTEQTSASASVQATTAQASTAQPTTAAATEPTSTAAQKEVISVVGYYYDYAGQMLGDAGFEISLSSYDYSSDYAEGIIISQTPESGSSAEEGSTVSVVVSLGEEPQETQAPAESSSTVEKTDNTYVISDSSSRYLTESEVEALSREEMNIALNEIYARHGRIFNDSELSAYFNSQSWYTPTYTPSEFASNVQFNEYEQANIELIAKVQQEKGYR